MIIMSYFLMLGILKTNKTHESILSDNFRIISNRSFRKHICNVNIMPPEVELFPEFGVFSYALNP